MGFEKKVQLVLDEYHRRMEVEYDMMQSLPVVERIERRDEFLLPVGQEVGHFLNIMVKASKAQTILEIGTSYGYSTLWLAESASHIGAKVITLEINNQKATFAKSKIAAAGLSNFVEFKVNDALTSLFRNQK